MFTDKERTAVYRKFEIRTIFPEGTLPDQTTVQRAPAGKAFTVDAVSRALDTVAARLKAACPGLEFKMIKLAPLGNMPRFCFKAVTPSDQTQITPS